MKRSLFSPFNILIVAIVAVAVWYYMKHKHNEEVVQPVVTEQVEVSMPVEQEVAVEAEAVEHTEENK